MVEERAGGDRSPPVSPGDDHGHDIYTIANIVTVLRLILVPIFFAVLINGENNVLAFVLFTIAASTDWLDGQIARRTGTVTAHRQGDRPAGRQTADRIGCAGALHRPHVARCG